MTARDRAGRRRPTDGPAAAAPAAARAGRVRALWRTGGELAAAFAAAAGVHRIPPPVTRPPLQQICADLHRIHVEILRVLADERLPARFHRLEAATLAYDAVLCDACRAVGMEPPTASPLGPTERLSTEALLSACGVHW